VLLGKTTRASPFLKDSIVQRFSALLVLVCLASASSAQEEKGNRGYPPNLPGAKVETYKTVGDVKLNLYIFNPEGQRPTDKRPAIVFFFGGGWVTGTPAKFGEQCKYLASRGMVAITADYRVGSRHQAKAVNCVADAKSAIRFVRTEAARLGVDPDKIVAGGGSAGGHIAACTGLIQGFDESTEDASISSIPNAMALFNPVVILAPVDGLNAVEQRRVTSLKDRMGTDPQALSPYHHIKRGAPSTIIFHGTADTNVPFRTVEIFTKAMTDVGNSCTLDSYEGQGHSFFNYGRGGNEYYAKTMRALDEFLAGLGYLSGQPTLAK
jgi:acetyl esterase/lipase